MFNCIHFCEGTTLGQRLQALGAPPDERWLIALLRPLLDALALMHEAHCFHRDISPDNILIRVDGAPMLLDFGAARMVIGDMTKALTVILKPGYAPIEQYGDLPAVSQGAWTDLYALGSVMHFAITGKTPPQAVARFMKDAYVPLATVVAGAYGERFLQAIDQSLAVEPLKRPQSAAEMLRLLGLQRANRQTMIEDAKVIAATGTWTATQALPAVADDETTLLRPAAPPITMPAWSVGSTPRAGRRTLVFGVIGAVGMAAVLAGIHQWRVATEAAPADAVRAETVPAAPVRAGAAAAGMSAGAAGAGDGSTMAAVGGAGGGVAGGAVAAGGGPAAGAGRLVRSVVGRAVVPALSLA